MGSYCTLLVLVDVDWFLFAYMDFWNSVNSDGLVWLLWFPMGYYGFPIGSFILIDSYWLLLISRGSKC